MTDGTGDPSWVGLGVQIRDRPRRPLIAGPQAEGRPQRLHEPGRDLVVVAGLLGAQDWVAPVKADGETMTHRGRRCNGRQVHPNKPQTPWSNHPGVLLEK